MPVVPESTGKKSQRASRPKVRTGCVTCKIRRVKCDEAKPECLRCTSTGRKCDGYVPPKTWLFEPKSEKRPVSGPATSSQAIPAVYNPEETRALQFYREKTACTLSNYRDTSLWEVIVPTIAQTNLPVKHITIAIADLHSCLEGLASEPGLSRLRYMQNYSKAVSLMTSGSNSLPTEIVLICSLLFAHCENFQGEPMTGLMHIEGGSRILREWRSQRPGTGEHRTRLSEMIERDIAPIFDQMESLQNSYRYLRSTAESSSGQTTPMTPMTSTDTDLSRALPIKPVVPSEYPAFCRARDHLSEMIAWVRYLLHWDHSMTPLESVEATAREAEAREFLSQWKTAFDGFRPKPGGLREKEFLRTESLLLRAHHHALSIMVTCLGSNSEMVFDDYVETFKILLDECSAAAIPPSSSTTFHFGFSLGLIPPLFLLATRCRDPIVRKSAISVLKSLHRSEGQWDSCSAAQIAEYIINIEERGLTVIHSVSDVPSFSRVRLLGAQVDYPNQQLVLRILRHPFDRIEAVIEEERTAWPSVVGQDRDIVEWPLDNILACVGYQGLIRPETGICRHMAAMGVPGPAITAVPEGAEP